LGIEIPNIIVLVYKSEKELKSIVSFIAHHCRPARPLWVSTVIVWLTLGCSAPGYRVHPEFAHRVSSITRPALMPLDVKVFESLPGGLVVLREDWTAVGKKNLQNAVVKGFAARNCSVRLVGSDSRTNAELAEIQSLYKIVNKSIRLQSYGRTARPNGTAKFEYSVGSLASILPKLNADAVIFVCALEKIASDRSVAVANLAIADSSGTIIWHSVEGLRDRHGLIDSAGAAELVENLMMSYPKADG
jgi:hypothetical protein